MGRPRVRAKKAIVPFDADPDTEESVAKQSAHLIVDREIKAELGFGYIISRRLDNVGVWVERATIEPTLRNFYALYRSLRTLNALVGPYTTERYKEQKRRILHKINGLQFESSKSDREMAIDLCLDWFEFLIEDMHRVGMLFKESIGAIV